MKLPDFTNDPKLLALRNEMRANAPGGFSPDFRPSELTKEELDQLAGGGIEVFFEEITRLEDGTLGYKDSRVLVYIRDIPIYGGEFTLPRFHVAFCHTLERMREAHRFERYVVATRDSGQFLIYKISNSRRRDSSWEKLNVCQNCLNELHFDGFSYSLSGNRRLRIVSEFSIPRFFEKYPKSLHSHRPTHNDLSAPINDYTADFDEISRRVKAARGYRCESCGRNPEAQFLNVHHVNGQKNDNSDANLRVLCLGCHAAMPLHGHMRRTPGFDDFQRKYDPNS